MKPTIEDLQRLLPDARAEYHKARLAGESPVMLTDELLGLVRTAIEMISGATQWNVVRAVAMRMLYLCALLAWEAGKRMTPPIWHLNVGGKLQPVDRPTDAETPAAKSVDVEALLREADAWTSKDAAPDPRCIRTSVVGRAWSAAAREVIGGLSAALRAERERANRIETDRQAAVRGFNGASHERYMVRRYLEEILEHGWPAGTTWPSVVRAARAFLAVDGQATRPEDDATWLRRMWDEEVQRHTKTQADDLAKMHEIGRLRSELAGKGAALARMQERYENATNDLARMTKDRNEWKSVAEAIGPAFQNDRSKLQAQLAAQDEAHAHTKAALAFVRKERDAHLYALNEERGAHETTKTRLHDCVVEVDALQEENRKALAAQNRAESDAASLRIEVADLRRTVAEGEALVDSLITWAKKGRA